MQHVEHQLGTYQGNTDPVDITDYDFSNIEIYGFSGKMGSGKDYVARHIFNAQLPHKPTLFLALADHLKVNVINMMNVPYDKAYGEKDEHSRKCLQEYGTDVIRKQYGEDFWARVLLTWIRVLADKGIERFMITDVRFPNEMKILQKAGAKIIRINAPVRNSARLLQEAKGDVAVAHKLANHRSELAMDDLEDSVYDCIVNNNPGDNMEVLEKYIAGLKIDHALSKSE